MHRIKVYVDLPKIAKGDAYIYIIEEEMRKPNKFIAVRTIKNLRKKRKKKYKEWGMCVYG